MRLKEFLKLCYHYDSNINLVKIIGITQEVKRLLASDDGVVLSSITVTFQSLYEDDRFTNFEVSEFGIVNDKTIFVKLC